MYIHRDVRSLANVKVLNKYMGFHNGFIAGGCFKNIFNGEKVKDVDIFFKCQEDFDEALKEFNSLTREYRFLYRNDRAVAFKCVNDGVVVELVEHIFGSPEFIIGMFDFSIVKIAYYCVVDLKERKGKIVHRFDIVHHKSFFEHLFFKRLVIESTTLPFPLSTFERALRYKGYGYNLCLESKHNLITAIKNSNNPEDALIESLYYGFD